MSRPDRRFIIDLQASNCSVDFGAYKHGASEDAKSLAQAHVNATCGAREIKVIPTFPVLVFDNDNIADFNYKPKSGESVVITKDEILKHQETLKIFYDSSLFGDKIDKGIACCPSEEIPGYLISLFKARTAAKMSGGQLPALNRLKYTATGSMVYYVASTKLAAQGGEKSLMNIAMKEPCVLISQPAINLKNSFSDPYNATKLGFIAGGALNTTEYEERVFKMVRMELYAFKEYKTTDVVLSMRGTGFFAGDFKKEARNAYARAVVRAYVELFQDSLEKKDIQSIPQYYLTSVDAEERDAFSKAIGQNEILKMRLVVVNRTQSQLVAILHEQKKAHAEEWSKRLIGINNAGDVLSVGGHGFLGHADLSGEEANASRSTFLETQDPQKNPYYKVKEHYFDVLPPNCSSKPQVESAAASNGSTFFAPASQSSTVVATLSGATYSDPHNLDHTFLKK